MLIGDSDTDRIAPIVVGPGRRPAVAALLCSVRLKRVQGRCHGRAALRLHVPRAQRSDLNRPSPGVGVAQHSGFGSSISSLHFFLVGAASSPQSRREILFFMRWSCGGRRGPATLDQTRYGGGMAGFSFEFGGVILKLCPQEFEIGLVESAAGVLEEVMG